MRAAYDAAVIGLGVTGAATVAELAGRGLRVVGLDRYTPPHPLGASHGRTRIIREAYFEDPLYVPWVRRSYDGWTRLEAWANQRLLVRTGALTLAPARAARAPHRARAPDSASAPPRSRAAATAAGGTPPSVAAAALESARVHGVETELLDAAAVARRFPGLAPPDDFTAVLDPGAGTLLVERCVRALHTQARSLGADLRVATRVVALEPDDGGITIVTDAGPARAGRVVIAAGAWTARLLPEPPPLTVERQTVHWFAPAEAHAESARAGAMPITLWQDRDGSMLYVIPDVGEGMKAGLHHGGPTADADDVPAIVSETEWCAVESRLRAYVPAAGARLHAAPCLYTNTPDRHFLLDAYPAEPRIVVASACSGHGFKFAPAIAQAVAARLLDEPFALDATPFRWSRWSTS